MRSKLMRMIAKLLHSSEGSVATLNRVPEDQEGVKGKYSVIDKDVEIGPGCSIWNLVYIGSHTTIGSNVSIGSLVHICEGSSIGDNSIVSGSVYLGKNTRVGRDCFLGPGSVTTGDPFPPVRRATGITAWPGSTVEDGAVIGAGARIKAGVVVGRRAVVGMGAIVLEDVPAETVVVGAPARPIYSRQMYDQKQLEFALKMGGAASQIGSSGEVVKVEA